MTQHRLSLRGGHLGALTSALLDGQLPEAESERAWQHVSECPECHGLVEREAWLKRRLSCLAEPTATAAPAGLKGALLAAPAMPIADPVDHPARSRRMFGLVAFGGGAVGAAFLSVLTVAAAPADAPSYQPNPAVTAVNNLVAPTGQAAHARNTAADARP